MSLSSTVLRYSISNNGVPLKAMLGVTQGHCIAVAPFDKPHTFPIGVP